MSSRFQRGRARPGTGGGKRPSLTPRLIVLALKLVTRWTSAKLTRSPVSALILYRLTSFICTVLHVWWTVQLADDAGPLGVSKLRPPQLMSRFSRSGLPRAA